MRRMSMAIVPVIFALSSVAAEEANDLLKGVEAVQVEIKIDLFPVDSPVQVNAKELKAEVDGLLSRSSVPMREGEGVSILVIKVLILDQPSLRVIGGLFPRISISVAGEKFIHGFDRPAFTGERFRAPGVKTFFAAKNFKSFSDHFLDRPAVVVSLAGCFARANIFACRPGAGHRKEEGENQQ